MRAARAADWRRRAAGRSYAVSLRSFSFRGVPGLGTGRVLFNGPLSAVCGGNGVGKTTILDGILAVLSTEEGALSERRLARLDGACLSCEVLEGGRERVFSVRVGGGFIDRLDPPPEFMVRLIDSGRQSAAWLEELDTMANLDEMLEAIEPVVAVGPQLEEIRYLVGKQYGEQRIFEIDELEGGMQAYFDVRVGNASYSCREMGLGELSLHMFHWQLANAPRDSIVLIEEPETFVSPRSQRCLIDVLSRYSVERGLFPVLSTHSWGVAGCVPQERVIIVHGIAAGENSIGVINCPRRDQINDVLAVSGCRKTLVLVEDEAAELVATAILEAVDPTLISLIEFRRMGDASKIEGLLSAFPRTELVTLVGMYDAGYVPARSETVWTVRHLPGSEPPERMLRSAIQGRVELVAENIRRPPGDVRAAHAALVGEDDHDWLVNLARSLHKPIDGLIGGLVLAWLATPGQQDEAIGWAQDLRSVTAQTM